MSEKRYYKLFASRHIIGKKNNYLRLFEAIEKQDVYDENSIKKFFEGETFIKHLPSEKNYLYHHILESLNLFNKEKTYLSRSSNTLMSIENLFNKGLFDQCKKLIKKTKEEALLNEKFSSLLIILRWETIIFIKDEDGENLEKNFALEQKVLNTMRIQASLMRLAFSIQIAIDKGEQGVDFKLKKEKELRRIFPEDAGTNSFWTNYYYYSSLALLWTEAARQPERYMCYREIKRIMDAAPQFIRELPAIYHLNYNNLVNVLLHLKKYTEAEKLIQEQNNFLQAYSIKKPTFANTVFVNTLESRLFLYYKTKRVKEASQLVKNIESDVKRINPLFSPLLYDLIYFMAVSELLAGNNKDVLKWLNKIFSAESKLIIRKEMQINARLLQLAALINGNDIIFENKMKATRRFISKETQPGKQAKILEALVLLEDFLGTGENKTKLKKFVQEIKRDFRTQAEELLNKNFDFVEWIEEKMGSA